MTDDTSSITVKPDTEEEITVWPGRVTSCALLFYLLQKKEAIDGLLEIPWSDMRRHAITPGTEEQTHQIFSGMDA